MVKIKQSKTDPFRHGVNLWLGKTDCTVCLVTDILLYLAARGPCPGSLFITSNRTYVMRQFFYSMLSTLLIRIGHSQKHFNTHSFRIGAATSAKAAIYISKHWKQCVPSIYQDSTYRDSSVFILSPSKLTHNSLSIAKPHKAIPH